MKKFYTILGGLFLLLLIGQTAAWAQQTVLDPDDPIVYYDSNNPPQATGNPSKWVITKGNYVTWNTSNWKAYYYGGMAFRILFPKSYKSNPNKKYPMLVFFHGEGEKGSIYDNQAQLYNCAKKIQDSVLNGGFDAFVLFPQSPYGGWYASQFSTVSGFINYMISNVRVDRFRIITNGLSSGGDGCWRFTATYPKLVAACVPMSATNPGGVQQPDFVNAVKQIPVWLSQGGKDADPNPGLTSAAVQVLKDSGMDIRIVEPGQEGYGPESEGFYITYPNNGHNTWDAHYAEPLAFQYMLRAYKSNPHVVSGRREFCPGTPFQAKLALTPGFDSYEWSKNGVVIQGANSNTLIVTDTGTYSARIVSGTDTSDWSRWPAKITYSQTTITPPIQVAGLMSRVIPAPDGNTSVNLTEPPGYGSYQWMDSTGQVVGTDRVFSARHPGKYIATVMEVYGCSAQPSDTFYVASNTGPNPPDAATDLTGYAFSQTAVQLNWSNNLHPVYNETAFEIYRATQAGGPYQMAGIVPADTLSFLDKGLSADTKYFYIVRAIDSTGAAKPSTELSVSTISDKEPPSAPQNLEVIGSTNNSISLRWDAATDNVGIKNYYIYINGVKSYIITDTTFTVYNLEHDQSYSFYIKASDPSDNISPASNQVIASAVYQGLTYKYYPTEATWSKIPDFSSMTPGATGLVDNITLSASSKDMNFGLTFEGFINITKPGIYSFYTNSDDGSNLYINNIQVVNNDGNHGAITKGGTYNFAAPGLYPFRVDYYQGTGGAQLLAYWKSAALGMTDSTLIPDSAFKESYSIKGNPPNVPSDLEAKAISYNKVNITWKDNSSDETGFEVYRSTNDSSWTIIGTTVANGTSLTDSTVAPSTLYYYKVQAINQYGGSGLDKSIPLGGLNYSYFESDTDIAYMPDFSGSPDKTGHLTNLSLDVRQRANNYAIKFSGEIQIPVAGNYTFYTKSDDGSILYIDGFDPSHMVVNNNFTQAATERSGSINLTAGVHPIYISYFQGNGDAVLTASYAGPGMSKQFIPDTALAAPGSYTTTFPLPAVPAMPDSLVAATDGNNVVNLTWRDNSNNETGFNVYRSDGNNTQYRKLKELPANSTTYSDEGLYANTTYYYKVEAVNIGGPSGFTNEIHINTSSGQGTAQQAIYINFNDGSYAEGGYWNNTNDANPSYGDRYTNLKDTLGNITNVGLKISSHWEKDNWQTMNYGATTGNNNGLFPDNVLKSSYLTAGYVPQTIEIHGLDPTYRYNLIFLGSRISGQTDNRVTVFQIGDESMASDIVNNTGDAVRFNDLQPEGDSTITFSFYAAQGSISGAGYLNAMVIRGGPIPNHSVPGSPTDINLLFNNFVRISWDDHSNNERGFQVYRKKESETNYSLLGSTSVDVTSFVDSTISPFTVYTYKVRAYNDYGTSLFTDSVMIKTPAMSTTNSIVSSFYINFNDGSYAEGGYWNNTNDANPSYGDRYYHLKDTLGNITDVGLEIASHWEKDNWQTMNYGATTGNNSGRFPDNVLKSSYITAGYIPQTIKINGLDPAYKYSLVFMGSRTSGQGDKRETVFQVGNQSVTNNIVNNTNNAVSLNNLQPFGDSTITFSFFAASGSVSGAGYLNALVIHQIALRPASPTRLQLNDTSDSELNKIKVSWSVPSNNADTVQVYRSTQKDSIYTLLNPVMANGKDTAYIDSTVNLNTTYYYYLVAANANGESAPSDTASITIVAAPVIDSIGTVVVGAGGYGQIDIHATSAIGNDITLTTTNLPSFAQFTDMGSGDGKMVIQPGTLDLGTYHVTVTAEDNMGKSSAQQFTLLVVDTTISTVKINFNGSMNVGTPWNNTSLSRPADGSVIANLKDENGQATGINLTFQEGWTGSNAMGKSTGNNSGIYPDSVMLTSYWDNSGLDKHIVLSGLSTRQRYNVALFGSRAGNGNQTTIFSIGAKKDSLNTINNTSNIVQFLDVTPDQNGMLKITVNKSLSAANSYLNALVIQGYDSSVIPPPVKLTAASHPDNSISLSWENNTSILTGTEVWRALAADGNYELIATVGGDSTSYSDVGLNDNTRYFYRLKTVRGDQKSAYSAIGSATTNLYSIYVNFDQNTPAPSPWNNLNTVPNVGNTFNLSNAKGYNTGITLMDLGGFSGVNPDGVNTGNNSGVYPDNVISSTYWVDASDTGKLLLQGFDLSMSYDLIFFGSRTSTADRTTVYIANDSSISLQAANNSMNTATIYNVSPNANGNISIGVTQGGSSPYGYIGALVILAHNNYDDSGHVIYNRMLSMYNFDRKSQMTDQFKLLGNDSALPSYTILTAYPNPFSQYVNIKMNSDRQGQLVLRLIGGNGNLMDEQRLSVSKGVNTIRYEPRLGLAPGFYILNILSPTTGKAENIKLIKR